MLCSATEASQTHGAPAPADSIDGANTWATRHRASVLVGAPPPSRIRNSLFSTLDRSIPKAREQAVIGFITRTLAASSQHRMILMGYIGSGLAILLSGLLGMHNVVGSTELLAASFIYGHIILSMFLLIGLR